MNAPARIRVLRGARCFATVFLWQSTLWVVLLLAGGALPAAALPGPASRATGARISSERSGVVPTRDGLRLTLIADTGNVHVFTGVPGEVRYRVRIEAEGNDPAASALLKQFSLHAYNTPRGVTLAGQMAGSEGRSRVWVNYEIHVPQHYGLKITTQAGDIVTQDVGGPVTLSTGGGNIRVGNIGRDRPPTSEPFPRGFVAARLETGGGHILVGNVAGSLVATTAGGHITAGNVQGDAVLHTGGGHIHVDSVSGKAELSTGGGNIVAERAKGGVAAETAGGQIELGEAAGMIRAHTGGGGIRIGRLAGSTVLDSGDGRIFLAGVEAPLRASTVTGTITAWFSPLFGDPSALPWAGAASREAHRRLAEHRSELDSGEGDIIVYLPRQLAVTIDALIEHGANHRIVADPSLPIKVSYENSSSGRALHGECALNGGGEVLYLKTDGGNIQLRLLDPAMERELARQQMEMVAQRLRAQKTLLLQIEQEVTADSDEEEMQGSPTREQPAAVQAARAASPADGKTGPGPAASGRFAELTHMIEDLWGRIRVAPEEQQKRLTRSVKPEYPDAARQAGIEGDVTLRVVIGRDGTVEQAQPLSGNPVLARSAVRAVEQWRYAPLLLDGRPVGVVTTVTLAFRLQS